MIVNFIKTNKTKMFIILRARSRNAVFSEKRYVVCIMRDYRRRMWKAGKKMVANQNYFIITEPLYVVCCKCNCRM